MAEKGLQRQQFVARNPIDAAQRKYVQKLIDDVNINPNYIRIEGLSELDVVLMKTYGFTYGYSDSLRENIMNTLN